MSNKEMYAHLYEAFPPEVERSLRKGGTSLTYIPVSEVITRLNKVFGVDKWDSIIVSCERDHHDPDFIVAHVRLTATVDGSTVVKDGVGGQKIKRTKNGDIVDLGDEFKGAVSDALKKAAQQFGIGLYLARTEEALYLEAAEEEVPANTIPSETWDTFKSHLDGMDDGEKAALKEWWANTYPDAGAPSPTNSTEEQIKAATEQAVIITLGATVVE